MVKVRDSSEYERLDQIIRDACDRHGLKLLVQGWTRKTYDIYKDDRAAREEVHLIRVESFATTSGEIVVYSESAMGLAGELGEAFEKAFQIDEAVIVLRT